jgi:hypothetical protein
MTSTAFRTVFLDPDTMFAEDLMADPSLAPQLSEPDRIPAIKAYAKGTFPNRKPDISTPRTDVYIVGWEDKDPDDPFYKD